MPYDDDGTVPYEDDATNSLVSKLEAIESFESSHPSEKQNIEKINLFDMTHRLKNIIEDDNKTVQKLLDFSTSQPSNNKFADGSFHKNSPFKSGASRDDDS